MGTKSLDSEQLRIIKAMTPAQRLEAADMLYQTAWKLKAAGLRAQHPDWNEDRVQAGVREAFLYATS